MKKKIIAIALCAILLIVALSACTGNKKGDPVNATVVINEGDSIFVIASKLADEGIISSSPWFICRLILTGDRSKLRYGTYNLSSELSYKEMIDALSSGGISTDVTMLTIPEGYSVWQIAELVDKSEINITAQDFYDALDDEYDYDFIKEIPDAEYDYKLQGFLFPSTYEFYTSATAHDVIDKLLGEFENQYKQAGENMTNLSMYEVVTVASIIEREALLKSELPTISGVVRNRLKSNMPLQFCATVVYAVTEGRYDINVVTYDDLKVDSLYNTYKYPGLPVGPISNPGLNALKAALNPEINEYLYYHTNEEKKDGSHIFTKTFTEHKLTMN